MPDSHDQPAMPGRVWVVLDEATGAPTQVATSKFYAPSGCITQAPYVPESRLHEVEAEREALRAELTALEETRDTYWVKNVNKLHAEHKALMLVLERSEEYIVCLDDSTAMAYDGATTRAVWRQAVEKARAILNA